MSGATCVPIVCLLRHPDSSSLLLCLDPTPTRTPLQPASSQLAAAASDLVALRLETDRLRLEVLPLLASATGRDAASFGPYLPPNYVRVIAERQRQAKVGSITLPASCAGGAAAGRRQRTVALNPDSFAQLHSLLT